LKYSRSRKKPCGNDTVFINAFHRINDMMDISADDLTSRNLYEFCHAADLKMLRKAHVDCKYKYGKINNY